MNDYIKEVSGYICQSEGTPQSSCQYVTLKVDSNMPEEINYSDMAQFWGVAFTSVVALFLISHGIGMILKLVRSA